MIRYAEPLLAATTLLLLCTKTGVNYPLIALALIGLWRLVRAPKLVLGDARLMLLGRMFLALWLPMLASLPGAVNFAHSASTTLDYVHFYFAAAAIVLALPRCPHAGRWVRMAAVAIAFFWVGDGLYQYVVGHDLFGYSGASGMLTGVFHPYQLLGLVLAAFAPIVATALDDASRRWRYAWLASMPYLAVVVLSAKRSAWTMILYAAAVYFGFQRPDRLRLGWRPIALLGLFAVLVVAGAWWTMPTVRHQAAHTAALLRGDLEGLDEATSYRVSLWRNAARLIAEHPWTGIGPRGFRHAYRDVAEADDFWLAEGRNGQTHPHQMALEIATETGLLGLAGYVVFWWLVFGALRRRTAEDGIARGWWAALVVLWLPLNMHLAFYGSYWSSFAWTVIALALAGSRPEAAADGRGASERYFAPFGSAGGASRPAL